MSLPQRVRGRTGGDLEEWERRSAGVGDKHSESVKGGPTQGIIIGQI